MALRGTSGIAVARALEPLDTEVAIETPEHIVFHHRIAGPARRALAHVLDLAICYGALAAIAAIALLVTVGAGLAKGEGLGGALGAGAGFASGLILLLLFAVQWIYFVAWEAVRGRSPGKAAVGLRVVTTSGRPIGWRAAALRNLLRTADLLPVGYVVGVVAMTLSPRFQRLGDLVAGTMVVARDMERAGRGRTRALVLSPPPAPRELAELPADVVLDAEERAAIELFLRRRGTLGVAREHELASMIAPRIGGRLGVAHPDPARLLALIYDRAVNSNAGRADVTSLPPPAPARGPA